MMLVRAMFAVCAVMGAVCNPAEMATTARVAGASALSVSSFPVSIPADGASTLRVEATIRDEHGAPVRDGTLVTFSASAGTIDGTVPTSEGVVTALLRSTTTPGPVQVTVRCGETQQGMTVYFAEKPRVLAAERTIQFVLADGVSASTIVARAGGLKSFVPDGTIVRFSTDLGDIVRQATTIGGQAVAVLTSTVPGQAHVTARCGPAEDTEVVGFVSPKLRLELGATPWFLRADQHGEVTLSAMLHDQNGRRLHLYGIPLEVETTRGELSTVRGLTRLGALDFSLRTLPGEAGQATVVARTPGAKASITLKFTDAPAEITLAPWWPAVALPDDTLRCRIIGTVKDSHGWPMPAGTEVSFRTNRGKITPLATVAPGPPCRGQAIAELRFPARVGEALVTATCEEVETSKSIRFSGAEGEAVGQRDRPGDGRVRKPAKVRVQAMRPGLVQGRLVHRVRALVTDATGKGLPGQIEYFDGGFGSFAPEYDSADPESSVREGAFKSWRTSIVCGNTGQWKTATAKIEGGRFANRCNGGDFRLAVAGGDLCLCRVAARRTT